MKLLRPCFVITLALLVFCCLLYPAVVTAGAQLALGKQANGSLIEREGKVLGSSLIGQSVADWAAHPEYLWGRPSAAYNDAATHITFSSGSNYGPMNPTLIEEVAARVALLRASGVAGRVPVDLVTKSASGLDPHLSPASAELQVARIATTRGIASNTVREAITRHTEGRSLGFLGEPRVNVLLVNLDLDARAPYVSARELAPNAAP